MGQESCGTETGDDPTATDASSADREAARERKREKRRAEKRRAKKRRQREKRRREAQLVPATPPEPESAPETEPEEDDGCHPSYKGACLDPAASDYDCEGGSGDGPEYASGPITVVGDDPYDLDRDGDGTACES